MEGQFQFKSALRWPYVAISMAKSIVGTFSIGRTGPKRSVLSEQDVRRIAKGRLIGQTTRCFSPQLYLAGEDARAVEQSHQSSRSDLSLLKWPYSLSGYQN